MPAENVARQHNTLRNVQKRFSLQIRSGRNGRKKPKYISALRQCWRQQPVTPDLVLVERVRFHVICWVCWLETVAHDVTTAVAQLQQNSWFLISALRGSLKHSKVALVYYADIASKVLEHEQAKSPSRAHNRKLPLYLRKGLCLSYL